MLVLVSFSTFASQEEKVIKVLSDFKHKESIEIQKDTFIHNILGYACPVPAINVSPMVFHFAALKHNRFRSFGVKDFALEVEDPNMRFCEWPSAFEIFGEEYFIGETVVVKIRTLLEIVERVDGTQRLRETVSTNFLGERLVSNAEISL